MTRRRIAVAGALTVLVVVVSLAYLPGLMTPDTLDMCTQALTGRINTWHSPIFVWAWRLTRATPEVLLVLQVVAFVGAVHLVLSRWLRTLPAVVATFLVVLVPTTIGWLGHIGKDQWSAISILLAIALLARLGDVGRRRRAALLTASLVLLWVATAARANAILPAATVLLLAGPIWSWSPRPGRRASPFVDALARVAIVGSFVGVTVVSQSLWVSDVVQAKPTHPAQPAMLYDLAGLSVRTGELLVPTIALKGDASLSDIEEHFTAHGDGGRSIFYGDDAPVRFRISNAYLQPAVREAWFDAVRAHPLDYLRHRAAFSEALLGISGPYSAGAIFDPGSRPEDWGLSCSLHERYVPTLSSIVTWAPRHADGSTLWRGWWIVLLLVGSAAVAGLRRCAEARMLLASSLVTVATFAGLASVPNLRYLWPVTVATAIVLVLAIGRLPALARDDPTGAPPSLPEGGPVEPLVETDPEHLGAAGPGRGEELAAEVLPPGPP